MSDELDKTLALVRKKFGTNSAQRLGTGRAQAAAQVKEVIPTGIGVIDMYLLGIGGLPIGRMSEVFSAEGAGKTTLSYHCAASCQRNGGVAVILDPEKSFDEERAMTMGVNLDDIIVLNPEHLEMAFEQMKIVLTAHSPTNGPMLLLWDSIAATKTRNGVELEAGKFRVGEVPRIMSEELPKLIALMQKHRAHLFALNQIREKIGVMFGPSSTTPGGHAVHFYASWRLQFFGGKSIKDKLNQHTGKVLTLVVAKTRFTAPFRKAKLRLDYATGWNDEWSTINHAKAMKVMSARNSFGQARSGPAAHMRALTKLGWPMGVMPDGVDPEDDVDGEDE